MQPVPVGVTQVQLAREERLGAGEQGLDRVGALHEHHGRGDVQDGGQGGAGQNFNHGATPFIGFHICQTAITVTIM